MLCAVVWKSGRPIPSVNVSEHQANWNVCQGYHKKNKSVMSFAGFSHMWGFPSTFWRSCHLISTTFRSRRWPGHSKVFVLFSLSHPEVDLDHRPAAEPKWASAEGHEGWRYPSVFWFFFGRHQNSWFHLTQQFFQVLKQLNLSSIFPLFPSIFGLICAMCVQSGGLMKTDHHWGTWDLQFFGCCWVLCDFLDEL